MATLRILFTTDLGAQVSVEAPEEALLETLRRYGRLGWFSGELPPGGLRLPYDNARDFDWALLGGKTLDDGSVWCRGERWEQQELEGAVLYSRLAKPSDPPALRHSFDGERERVTLAIFKDGERQEAYALPASQEAAEVAEAAQEDVQEEVQEDVREDVQQDEVQGDTPQEDAPRQEELPSRAVPEGVLKMWANIGQLLSELEAPRKRAAAKKIMAELGYTHEETEDIETGRKVYRELRALLK